jgi:[acyl-carrier-protein] S-malonyltransferase
MGAELAKAYPEARAVFAEVDEALGQDLSRLMWEGPEDKLTLTENAQPALMAVSLAAMRVLAEAKGIKLKDRVAYVAGHSLGEYSALAAAGALTLADTARLLKTRGCAMQEAVPVGQGAMAALLGADLAQAQALAKEAAQGQVCEAANDNAPGQVVISGAKGAIERAVALAPKFGARRAVLLPVSAPFHCALMKPAEERLAPELRALPVHDPRVPIVANVDAAPKRIAAEAIEALVAQVSAPVRWEAVIGRLASEGVTTYVEVGPGTVLSGLVRKIQRGASVVSFGAPGDLAAVQGLL